MRTLVIRRRVVPCKGGLAIEEQVKSDASARVVSVDAQTCELIEKSLAGHDSPWLFHGRDKTQPMNPTSMSHKVSKLGKQLDTRLHPHALKHFCATESLAAGIPLPIVAARLGNTVSTIHAVYAHAIRSNDRGAADAMASSLTQSL
jgi:integrase